jgi:hypothetical protein
MVSFTKTLINAAAMSSIAANPAQAGVNPSRDVATKTGVTSFAEKGSSFMEQQGDTKRSKKGGSKQNQTWPADLPDDAMVSHVHGKPVRYHTGQNKKKEENGVPGTGSANNSSGEAYMMLMQQMLETAPKKKTEEKVCVCNIF